MSARTEFKARLTRLAVPLLGLGVFVLYLATLAPGAFPGISAPLIVQHAGLDPFPPLAHPLWTVVVHAVAAVPIGGLAVRLNAFSALCAAGAVMLLASLLRRVPHDRTTEESMVRYPPPSVQVLSGLVAGAYLAVSIPFWIVADRAHPLSMDLCLLLGSLLLLFRYARTRSYRVLLGFAGLYGLGLAEYPSMIPVAPVAGLVALSLMWRAGHLRPLRIAGGVAAGLAGLSLLLVYALWYRTQPAYAWRAFQGFHELLYWMLLDQYRTLRAGFPQVGWLLLALTAFIPWLIVVAFPKRLSMQPGALLGSRVLHLLLTALTAALLFDVTLSPWRVLGMQPLLVMPYVFLASTAGYLAGYWYIALSRRRRGGGEGSAPAVRAVLRVALLVAIVGWIGAAVVRNLPTATGRHCEAAVRFARAAVARLDGRSLLIADGPLNDNLAVAAREQGLRLDVVDPQLAFEDSYRRYVAALFDRPRLEGLARIGLGPLWEEWFRIDPGVADRVAILRQADLWAGHGYEPVPNGFLFLGSKRLVPERADELLAVHDAVLPEALWLAERAREEGPAVGLNRWMARHLSKVANNLGVVLEDLGRPEEARRVYDDALRLNPDNVSAMLNAVAAASAAGPDAAAEAEERFGPQLAEQRNRLSVWSLAHHHGYVRRPELFVGRGWAWAMTGKPNLAIQDFERAMRMGVGGPGIQLALAQLYFMRDEGPKSEALYLGVLAENPENPDALLGLARIGLRRGDFASARALLKRFQAAGGDRRVLRMEVAVLESMAGRPDRGLAILDRHVQEDPDDLRAWLILAVLAAEQDDEPVLERCMARFGAVESGLSETTRMAVAHILLQRGELELARSNLEQVVRAKPYHSVALELLLRLDVQQLRRDDAREHVEMLLYLNPSHPYANYVLATLHILQGEYYLAEAALRTALEEGPSVAALNDLAWVLYVTDRPEQAEQVARDVLASAPDHAGAWDTLGSVLLAGGRLEEAEEALERAHRLQPDHPEIVLHLAQLRLRQGRPGQAVELAEPLLGQAAQIPPATHEQVRDLVRQARAAQ